MKVKSLTADVKPLAQMKEKPLKVKPLKVKPSKVKPLKVKPLKVKPSKVKPLPVTAEVNAASKAPSVVK
jgi:hypothetical protein